MSVAFRDASPGVTASTVSSIDLVVPATTVSGDLMVAGLNTGSGGGRSITTPTGWTVMAGSPFNSGGSQLFVFSRTSNGTEAGTTVTFVIDSNTQVAGAIWVGHGQVASPFGTLVTGNSGGNPAFSQVGPTSTVFAGGVLLTLWGAGEWNSGPGLALPATSRVVASSTPAASLGISEVTASTTGSYAGGTATSSSSEVWSAVAIPINSVSITSQTQLGKSRISIQTPQTQLGKSRITGKTPQTQLGKSRITITTLLTQLGKSRIVITTLQTQLGKIRIAGTTSQTQLGKASIGLLSSRTQLGKANIGLTSSRTQLGKTNIAFTSSRPQQGQARIAIVSTKTQLGKSRIAGTTLQTQLGKASVLKISTLNQLGRARIAIISTKTQLGKSRVTDQTPQTQPGKARITVLTRKTQVGLARIAGPVRGCITTSVYRIAGINVGVGFIASMTSGVSTAVITSDCVVASITSGVESC